MIQIDPRLHPLDRRTLGMYANFFAARGVETSDLTIRSTAALSAPSWLEVIYEPKTAENGWLKEIDFLNASVRLGLDEPALALTCSLGNAQSLAVSLVTTDLREKVSRLPRGAVSERAFSYLDLDASEIVRPRMAGWSVGTFVSPETDGFVCYYVDVHGEITVSARAAEVSPLAVFVVAQKAFEAQRLIEGVLPYRPPA